MKYIYLLSVVIMLCGCSSNEEDGNATIIEENVKTTRFIGNYNKGFNDLHNLHTEAAKKNGITPLDCKADTSNIGDKLIRLPQELVTYKTDRLSHSIPFLVPKAADLLLQISENFRDSLISQNIPLHKLVVTSVTRTNEDIKKLTKRNINASNNSAHCYGTTFDISWKRYQKINPYGEEVSSDKLKFVLGQVLHDLRERKKCYIKHEKKQACFHITVR